MKERLKKQIQFIKEIDKEKMIKRQTLLTNGMQKEDDAQHAWQTGKRCGTCMAYGHNDTAFK